jgi:hypothetical protein
VRPDDRPGGDESSKDSAGKAKAQWREHEKTVNENEVRVAKARGETPIEGKQLTTVVAMLTKMRLALIEAESDPKTRDELLTAFERQNKEHEKKVERVFYREASPGAKARPRTVWDVMTDPTSPVYDKELARALSALRSFLSIRVTALKARLREIKYRSDDEVESLKEMIALAEKSREEVEAVLRANVMLKKIDMLRVASDLSSVKCTDPTLNQDNVAHLLKSAIDAKLIEELMPPDPTAQRGTKKPPGDSTAVPPSSATSEVPKAPTTDQGRGVANEGGTTTTVFVFHSEVYAGGKEVVLDPLPEFVKKLNRWVYGGTAESMSQLLGAEQTRAILPGRSDAKSLVNELARRTAANASQ